jgi:hypothetical protein
LNNFSKPRIINNIRPISKTILSKNFSLNKSTLSSTIISKSNVHYILPSKNSKIFQKIKYSNNKNSRGKKLMLINDYVKKTKNTPNAWSVSLKFSKENTFNVKGEKDRLLESSYLSNKDYTDGNTMSLKCDNELYYNEFFRKSLKNYDTNFEEFKNRFVKPSEDIKTLCQKIKHPLKFNSGIPIDNKIKMLKERKNSIDKIIKNKSSSTLCSTKSIFGEESDKKFILELGQNFFKSISYKDNNKYYLNRNKPVVIKYMAKPKLNVPKFKNVNNINIF